MALVKARADETHTEFLRLKAEATKAQGAFYAAVTNGAAQTLGEWVYDHGQLIKCVFSSTNNVVTNIKYFVSSDVATTNVHGISCFSSTGVQCIFRYSRDRRISIIEEWGPGLGDGKVYFTGADGDLDQYCTVTNFFGAHGVRHYKNGVMVSEDKGLVDFSIFK